MTYQGKYAHALARQIAAGDMSATEAFRDSLAKVRRDNVQVNCMVHVNEELGLGNAWRIDEELARLNGEQRAQLLRDRPYLGVPFAVKDLGFGVEGLPSSSGSQLFKNTPWNTDSELVRRYKRLGLNIFARTTTSELGTSPTTEAPVYGPPTRNPRSLAHSAGGSSGGAAAAVAAGFVELAHGGDGAGSIRIPASNCGLFGFKPSRGMMPGGPHKGEGWAGLAVDHVITRTVIDSAVVLDGTYGADAGCQYMNPAFSRSFEDVVTQGHATPARRAAFLPESHPLYPRNEEVRQAYEGFRSSLLSLGFGIRDAFPAIDLKAMVASMLPLIAANAAHAVVKKVGEGTYAGLMQPTGVSMVDYAMRLGAIDYARSMDAMNTVARAYGRFFKDEGIDIIALPVLSTPPALIGAYAANNPDYLDYRLGEHGIFDYSPYTPLANMAGAPAASLPVHVTREGLPVGIQIMAPIGRDDVVFEVSALFETRVGFSA
ncbi:MAG: amidase [Burkholderiaceae bacterium]|jgi:amidase|nr:amidase [Burkholderiaceae bacterium]